MNVSQPTISVALTMISIPLSMIFWTTNILFKKLYGDTANELNGKFILHIWFPQLFILVLESHYLFAYLIYFTIQICEYLTLLTFAQHTVIHKMWTNFQLKF